MRGARMLKRGRQRAVERMDATCLITRPGEKAWDEESGTSRPVLVIVYEGMCQLVGSSTGGRQVNAADQLLVLTSPSLRLPMDAVGVAVSDHVTITACVSRPSAAGEKYTVREPADGTQVTALRYRLEAGHGR